ECNAPTILLNNLATKNIWAFPLPDGYYKEYVRPLKNIKGNIYLGHRNLYEFPAKLVEQNEYKTKNKSNFDELKDSEGAILNNMISCFDICARTMSSACVAFKN